MTSKVWTIILMVLCISGCTGERCIEADDFGFANFVVSSRYDPDELKGQIGGNQVAPWRDSKFRVNGRPLAILVRGWTYGEDHNWPWELSAWSAWFGDNTNAHTLSQVCSRLQDCEFIDDQMCTNTKDARIINAPCLFRNGVGLYALIARKGTDPNQSFTTMRDPEGLTFHLGDKHPEYEMLDISQNGKTREAGGLVYKYIEDGQDQAALKRNYQDSKLYFKILDKYYNDNNGHYRVSIKSGITDTSPDPIGYLTKLIKNFLFGTSGDDYGLIRKIYLGIVNNPGYRMAVSALLTLYIMFTGFEYLTGNINVSHTELIVRVIKIAIVSALLSAEYSWTFFNDYLFVYFIGGVEQILQIVVDAGSSGPGSPTILGMMIAPQTLSKLFSVLFVDWLGFIYIILFFIALYFVLLIFLQAAVIYLSALIAIGLIITMGPIFICFLLFGVTKSLFENWLKQLISYAIQPIILFTGLIFISMILRNEIYSALGFRVCKFGFPKLMSGLNSQIDREALVILSGNTEAGVTIFENSLFYWWFPNPMKGEKFSRTTVKIPIPQDHFDENGDFCEAYGCVGERYPDLPFLDPVKDKRRLNAFWNGKFVHLDGLLLIFVAIYLLHKFNGLAIGVARFIAGTSGNLSNIKNVGDSASHDFRSKLGQMGSAIRDKMADTKVGRTVVGMKGTAAAAMQSIKEKPSKMIDQARIASLKKDALGSGANDAVLKEVKKNTGLQQSDLKSGAIGDYKKEIANRLRANNTDGKLTEKQINKMASKLSKGGHIGMEDRLAKLQYDGKSFKDLDASQQEKIRATLKDKYGGKSMAELSKDAMAARRFQEAYVDAHQSLSARGVGLVGKHVSPLQSMQEIDHRVKQEQQREALKQRQTGQEIYAGYEGLKSGLYEKTTGDKDYRSGVGKGFGQSYNQIDQNNARKQTYAETLADQRRDLEHQKIKRQLEQLNNRSGDNVTSPEYLARQAALERAKSESLAEKSGTPMSRSEKLAQQARENADKLQREGKVGSDSGTPQAGPVQARTASDKLQRADKPSATQSGVTDAEARVAAEQLSREAERGTPLPKQPLSMAEKLAREDVKYTVYSAMTEGKDPALLGDKYMKEYAKDSELRHKVDRAYEVKKEIMQNDEFINREQHYETVVSLATKNIEDKHDLLKNHYKRKNISAQEMPSLLESYYAKSGDLNQVEAKQEVSKLKKNMAEFEQAQGVLQKIDERKQMVSDEVDGHVNKINGFRKSAGMEEYKPQEKPIQIRSVRKIEDHLRNL